MAEGWCSLCKSPYLAAINKLIEDGKNAGEAGRAMAVFDVKFDRHTFYKHKGHASNSEVMQTQVEKARQAALNGEVPKSTRAVLEKIRDLGIQNALNNPEEVTVDHALKAASELNKQETKTEGFMIVLAKAAMGQLSQDVEPYIIGEYQEVPQLEASSLDEDEEN